MTSLILIEHYIYNCRIHIIFKYIETFTNIDNMLSHKTEFNECQRIKIMQIVLSDLSNINLGINRKESYSSGVWNDTLFREET